MTQDSAVLVQEAGDDVEETDLPRRHKSIVTEKNDDKIEVCKLAEEEHQEYRTIMANAKVPEDVPNDCWGGLIFIIVCDFPDIRAHRAVMEGKIRVTFCFFMFLVNLSIQAILLCFIGKLLMLPGILSAQNLYKDFRQKAYHEGIASQDHFDELTTSERDHLCGMALSQHLFVRVILFLWVTTNVGELRDNFAKAVAIVNLPALPKVCGTDIDTRVMVRDMRDSGFGEFCVVCLNMKGKVGLFLLVFIPKFIIAVLLTFTGCLWLIAAESIGDLILNSLALAFVVKVDELIAAVFYPARLQDDIATLCILSPTDPDETDDDLSSWNRSVEFVQCALTLVATMTLVQMFVVFQPVLPFYGNDVADLCVAYLDTQVPWCLPWQSDCFPARQ
jgi:hypothetical protein